ncbi:unnamed protein product [Auanema sp. JU1783]|nr:unnamed protein product [Auanema sp. JU1783]
MLPSYAIRLVTFTQHAKVYGYSKTLRIKRSWCEMENLVTIRFSDEELQFETSRNLLKMDTLKTQFLLPKNSLIALRYNIDSREVGCQLSEDGTAFLLPTQCAGYQFYLKSNMIPSRPATPMNQDMIQSSSLPTAATEFDSFSRYLFYTRIVLKNSNGDLKEDVKLKYPCVPFQSSLLAHRGDKLNVYDSTHAPHNVEVVFYDDDSDFIIFESAVQLIENTPIPMAIKGGSRYVLLGYAEVKQQIEDSHMEPCYASGVIISSQSNEAGHICGSSGGIAGLSGGPVFDLFSNNLLGICVSTDDLDDRITSFGRFSSDMITYCKEITIVRIMPVFTAACFFHAHEKNLKLRMSDKEKSPKRKVRRL